MASDLAVPPTQLPPQSDNMDTSSQDQSSFETPTVNGDHAHADEAMQQPDSNNPAPAEDHLTTADTAIETKISASSQPDINPAGPTPVDDVASGMQPVADFAPKTTSNLSHPTPPPDEPLTTGEANVDVEMANVESDAQSPVQPEPVVTEVEQVITQSEPSLVRPREDDDVEEPAAKRSRVDDVTDPAADAVATFETATADAPPLEKPVEVTTTSVIESAEPSVQATEESFAEPSSIEATQVSIAEPEAPSPREAPPVESPGVKSPAAELPKAEESSVESPAQPAAEPSSTEVKAETAPQDTQLSDAPPKSLDSGISAPVSQAPTDSKPAGAAPSEAQPASGTAPASEEQQTYSKEPMTTVQKNSLIEKMKNLKKTKNSVAFLKPVDYVTLNIPTYPEIIKNPMDLGTMEAKLKEGQYKTVQEFADDFALIISNVRRFNGDAHAITQAGLAMEAYFKRMMQSVPTADMTAPPKVEKRRSPSITREKPPRREARNAAPPPTVPAPAAAAAAAAPAGAGATAAETYALQPDGTPQIRRQSSNVRPARAIKPPQNREIPYAKPKRKEHQLELRFCEHVLDEVRSPKYGHLNHVFLMPVDPVALNIPHYRQVIKTPMDLTTMSQKLRNGQYGTAIEFKRDFELMVKNCLTFNPIGNPVRDLGVQLQREFEALWSEKSQWERKNQPASARASSASGDESGGDEDDEEDDDGEDDKAATIRALQKQLADMQSALSGMAGEKAPKPKKSKSNKSNAKKIGSVSSAPKSKAAAKPAAKPKKQRQVTYDEKQEISEAVGKMDEKQVTKLTDIITQNCAKYRDMEEMELEIDDLPNDVQLMLLDYVRRIFGNPNKKKAREASPDDAAALDDDDFEPERGGKGGKRKKHKPMGKKEQQDTIDNIKSKLAQFSQVGTSASESPTNSSFPVGAQAETSGDEESEESEEE